MCGRRNGLIGRTSMMNERSGQFYMVAHCKLTRKWKTEARMGLIKNTNNAALKQDMYRYILVFLAVPCCLMS